MPATGAPPGPTHPVGGGGAEVPAGGPEDFEDILDENDAFFAGLLTPQAGPGTAEGEGNSGGVDPAAHIGVRPSPAEIRDKLQAMCRSAAAKRSKFSPYPTCR